MAHLSSPVLRLGLTPSMLLESLDLELAFLGVQFANSRVLSLHKHVSQFLIVNLSPSLPLSHSLSCPPSSISPENTNTLPELYTPSVGNYTEFLEFVPILLGLSTYCFPSLRCPSFHSPSPHSKPYCFHSDNTNLAFRSQLCSVLWFSQHLGICQGNVTFYYHFCSSDPLLQFL